MFERYVAELLPGASRLRRWGVLDCKLDKFVKADEPGPHGGTVELRFEYKQSAQYEARKRNATMTLGDV